MRLHIIVAAAAMLATLGACQKSQPGHKPASEAAEDYAGAGVEALDPDTYCVIGPTAEEPASLKGLRLAAVKSASPVHFRRQKAYLVPGDTVVLGESKNGWSCAAYERGKAYTDGWLPDARLDSLPIDAAPPLAAWRGRWVSGDNSFTIGVEGADLSISGEAFWPARKPPPPFNPEGVNLGSVEDRVRPAGDRAVIEAAEDFDCSVSFRLMGDYLAVVDNRRCGGANVTFTGLYRRKG